MKKLRVITLLGTRPEIIRLSETIKLLDRMFEQFIVHTGQNYDYELNQVFFEDLDLRKPDRFLDAAGSNAMETIANIFVKFDALLEELKPDALLVLGDTNSCLGAYPAKRRHVPIFHMEAGNRCFDFRVPEETNRRIVDHISDVNLTYTEQARDYLRREGFPDNRIIKTGSPLREVLAANEQAINASDVLSRLKLECGKYFVLSIHREENVEQCSRIKALGDCLEQLCERYDYPVIFSVHPRTASRLEREKISLPKQVVSMKPLGFHDYNALQKHSFCVISDSGTITEEAAILKFSGVTPRQAHERPEGMDSGVVVMCDLEPESMLQAVEVAEQKRQVCENDYKVQDYSYPSPSLAVANAIQAYTGFVQREVWKQGY